jgi:hypothetical protein
VNCVHADLPYMFIYLFSLFFCGKLILSKYIAQIWSDVRCYPSCNTGGVNGLGPSCSPECSQYRGTFDVFSKVTRQVNAYWASLFMAFPLFYSSSVVMTHNPLQEGMFRLWRGTGASLALAVPTVNPFSWSLFAPFNTHGFLLIA